MPRRETWDETLIMCERPRPVVRVSLEEFAITDPAAFVKMAAVSRRLGFNTGLIYDIGSFEPQSTFTGV